MSHPKNSTTPPPVQQPALREIAFGDGLMEYTEPLFCVQAGGSLAQGVETASDLAEGLTQLLMRQHMAVNYGEQIYTQEVRALAFLSSSIWALACSAKNALQPKEPDQEGRVTQEAGQ